MVLLSGQTDTGRIASESVKAAALAAAAPAPATASATGAAGPTPPLVAYSVALYQMGCRRREG